MEESFEQVLFLAGQNIFLDEVSTTLGKYFLASLFWYPLIDTMIVHLP